MTRAPGDIDGPQRRPVAAPALLAALALAIAPLPAALLAAQPNEPVAVQFTVTGYRVEGENPLAAARTRAVLAPFTGEHLDLERLQEASEALEAALRAAGYPFHRVVIPPQRSASGEIRLEVLAFRIGRIEVRGNRHFTAESVLRMLPALRAGEPINARRLDRSLKVANQHPAKRLRLTMRESNEPDRIDALVEVNDRPPWRLFASLANRGSAGSGRNRLSLGAQHSNLFGRDHSATLSYITSPNHTRAVRQVGAFYRIPFYRAGATLDASFVYSEVDSGTVAEFFDVSGSGRFWGLRYTQALPRRAGYRHSITIGLEDRFFDDRLRFDAAPIGNDVRSRPLSLGYRVRWSPRWGSAEARLDYARNLPGGTSNSAADYVAARAGARRGWDVLRYGASLLRGDEAGWRLLLAFDGQWSNEPLISGEQFGLGGPGSVRGFEDREISGDRGVQASLELTTPPLAPGLHVLGFLEGGQLRRIQAQPGERSRETAAALGLGLRWQWGGSLGLELDYGYVVNGAGTRERGDDRLHFTFLWSS